MTQPILYGITVSPFTRKVRLFMKEKGLAYQFVPMLPKDMTPEVRDHSPLGKLPVCRVDDQWFADSSVICAYLEKAYPQDPLYPLDAVGYAQALWFEEYIDTGAIPKLSPIFIERVLAQMFYKRPTDEARVAKIIAEDLPPVFDYLDREIGSKRYFVGERITLADLTVGSFFVNMQHAKVEIDRTRWPNLARYVHEQFSRAHLAAIIAEEQMALAAMGLG